MHMRIESVISLALIQGRDQSKDSNSYHHPLKEEFDRLKIGVSVYDGGKRELF